MITTSYLKKIAAKGVRPAIGLITLLSVLMLILLGYGLFFFNANDYKQEITEYLSQKTQMNVLIQGDMHLKWLPHLALSVQDIALHSRPQQTFLNIKQLELRVPLSTLLQKSKTIETLEINGLTLSLEKNRDDEHWQDVFRHVFTSAAHTSIDQTSLPSATKHSAPAAASAREHRLQKLDFSVARIEVRNSEIHYSDPATQQQIKVKNMHLFSTAAQLQNIPLTGQFSLEIQGKQTIYANAKISGFVHIKPTPSFKFDTFAFVQPNKQLPATRIKGLLEAQFNEGFSWKSLEIKSGDNLLHGNVRFDIEKHWQGQFHMKTLSYQNWHLHDVTTRFHSIEPHVIVGHVTAQTLEGQLKTQFDGHFSSATPRLTLKGTLQDFDAAQLLHSLHQPNVLLGKGSLDFDFVQESNAWHGKVKVDIQHGQLSKVDIPYYFHLAESLFKNQDPVVDNHHATDFDSLSGTFYVHDNQIENPHLTVLATEFQASATGHIYLPSPRLDYQAQAYRLHQNEPKGLPLAIRIKGTLSQPMIEPHVDLYLKALMKEKTQKKIEKKIDQHLYGRASESLAASRSQEIKKKMNKELDKGLKRLLKRKNE